MRFAVISIKPKYVEAIVEGQKVYELRRRKPNLERGDLLFIYGASCEAARKCVMFPLENGSNSIFISKLLTYNRKILSGNT